MTMIFTDARERGRFIKFAIVGLVGTVVDFGVFNLFSSLLLVAAVPASIFSFLAAVVSNFTWNRYWTYPDSRSKPVSKQAVEFTVISVIGLVIRTPLFVYLEQVFVRLIMGANLQFKGFLTPIVVAHNLALAVAIVVVLFWNFFINRYWTYGDIGN